MPQISAWDAQGERDKIERLLPKVISAALILIIPAFFGVVLFSKSILSIIFGPAYEAAWLVLIVLMGGKLIEGVDRVFKSMLSGLDRPDLKARAVVLGILLNVVLNFALISWFGIVGAAFATTLSLGVSFILITYYLSSLLTIRFPTRDVGWAVASGLGMSGILWVARSQLMPTNLLELFAFVALGVVSYSAFLLSVPSLRGMFLTHLRTILS
jgi:O-antigen/teichoic acid export membrane protein